MDIIISITCREIIYKWAPPLTKLFKRAHFFVWVLLLSNSVSSLIGGRWWCKDLKSQLSISGPCELFTEKGYIWLHVYWLICLTGCSDKSTSYSVYVLLLLLIYNTEQKTAGQKQQNWYFHSLTMKLRKLVLGVWILFPMTYNESVLGRDLLIVSITRSLKQAQTVSLISLLLKDMKNCETIL